MASQDITPILMSQSNELIPVVDHIKKADGKKRKIEVVDEASFPDSLDGWMKEENGQKWSVVYNKITRHRDGGISGRVFKLDKVANSELCCQIIKKYNKFNIHVGCYKVSVTGGAPEAYDSGSYVARKGLSVMSEENVQALAQLENILKEEMAEIKQMYREKQLMDKS